MKMIGIEKWFINRPRHGERVVRDTEQLLRHVEMKGGKSYLEVGCGVGAVSIHVARHYGLDVTGVDVDPDQVKLAQEKAGAIPHLRFLTADATRLPFPDDDFDIVLSSGTTHHIPDWLGALGEMTRVLKAGGFLLYRDLVYPKWLARVAKPLLRNYGITTLGDLNAFAASRGLSPVHTWSSGWWHHAVYQKRQGKRRSKR